MRVSRTWRSMSDDDEESLPYMGMLRPYVFSCPRVFDRQLRSGEPGGYLARYTPIWPGDFRPARSESCSFADGPYHCWGGIVCLF